MSEKRFVVPEVIATHFHLRPGDSIGDFGAGSGHFEPVLSRAVGPTGHVYAVEIQKNLVEALEARLRQERLGNVEVIWGDLEAVNGTKIKDDTLDAALVANCLFQAEDKAAAMKEITRTLRSGGKLFIIDWSESWGGIGPQPGHVLSESDARAYAEGEGLTFERAFDAGDHHYGLSFRKS